MKKTIFVFSSLILAIFLLLKLSSYSLYSGQLVLEIMIQCGFPALEGLTIMRGVQRYQTEWSRHSSLNSWRCRSKARRRAGAGSGGLSSASAKRC